VVATGQGFSRNGGNFRNGNNLHGGNNFRDGGNFRGRRGQNQTFIYAYPVFVGSYEPAVEPVDPIASAMPFMQAPPVSMYPIDSARPVMIQPPPSAPPGYPISTYQPRVEPQAQETQPAPEGDHYLIAFKDHTVYTAVAYWFDGDTLHYFTTGSTHNQASITLVDRELTLRLNKELGIDFHMPPAK
jgi:hypothetical protein